MNTSVHPGIAWYDDHATGVIAQYEALSFPQVHAWLLDRLPAAPGAAILDIGAGSGRDAAWLAGQGYDVVAVEPARALREAARQRHPDARIQWLDDQLPDLSRTPCPAGGFDVILVSAVWMHVPPAERGRAFRKLITLLKPGGLLAITLRLGEPDTDRGMHAVCVDGIRELAREYGARVEHVGHSADALGRDGVSWAELAVRRPDDTARAREP